MDTLFRTIIIYVILFILFRFAGKRSHLETPFSFVILVALGAATAQTILFGDYSATNLLIILATIFVLDFLYYYLAQKYPKVGHLLSDTPLILMENGEYLKKRMEKAGVTESEIIEAARETGVSEIEKIQYAVLETNGKISIIPKKTY